MRYDLQPNEAWNIVAGELRHLVAIEEKTVSSTSTRGHAVRAWATGTGWGSVNAKIETPSGRKLELARQYVSTCSHVITMYFRNLDANRHRINFGGRIFSIGWVQNVEERGVAMILYCTEEKPKT